MPLRPDQGSPLWGPAPTARRRGRRGWASRLSLGLVFALVMAIGGTALVLARTI